MSLTTLDPALLLLLAAIAGTFCHWLHGRLTGRIPGNPLDYLIRHPRHTVAMFLVTLLACAGVIAVSDLASMDWRVLLGLGFTTGWTSDSAINKGPGQ